MLRATTWAIGQLRLGSSSARPPRICMELSTDGTGNAIRRLCFSCLVSIRRLLFALHVLTELTGETLINDPWYKRVTWQIKQQLQAVAPAPPPPPAPPLTKQSFLKRSLTARDIQQKTSQRPDPQRSASLFTFGSNPNAGTPKAATIKKARAEPLKEKIKPTFVVKASKDGESSGMKPYAAPKQSIADCEVLHVPPEWLVILLESLKTLSSEYPVLMSAASAILITVGTIPSLPVVSAGAAGAFLASGTAQTLGSLAVGLGTLFSAQQTGLVEK